MASACCQVAIHGSLFLGKKEVKILHTVNKQAVSFVSDFVHIRPQKIKVFFLNKFEFVKIVCKLRYSSKKETGFLGISRNVERYGPKPCPGMRR